MPTNTPAAVTHSSRAFSLIELLAVITVLAVLSVLVFPYISQMRQKANTTTALSNLRQIYLGLTYYQNEHGKLPPLTSTVTNGPSAQEPFWNQRIIPYVEPDFVPPPAPENQLPGVFYDPNANSHNYRRGDFGVLYDSTRGPIRGFEAGSLSLAQIERPGHTVLLSSAEQSGPGNEPIGTFYINNNSRPSLGFPRMAEGHQGMAVVCFADGSIHHISKADLYADGVLPFRND
ncbi:MAG: type II secretion system protein [Verrucomicrobiota bacterium JB024]|nr:type II secretion system protein [Verrucomicrobiota bacterium JB024]